MLFSKTCSAINILSKRFVGRKPKPLKSWPNDWVPFHWSRPEHVPGYFKGGDLEEIKKPNKSDMFKDTAMSEKLNALDVDDYLRRTFSVDHGVRGDWVKFKIDKALKELGIIHLVDYPNSREAKIVALTFYIRNFVDLIKTMGTTNEKTNVLRTRCNAFINRRNRYLIELKELHSDRYQRILKNLKLEPRHNPINVPYVEPFRKKQMYRLTVEYCQELKERKVKEFLESLKSEKEEFEKEKKETLEWIKEQRKYLGISV